MPRVVTVWLSESDAPDLTEPLDCPSQKHPSGEGFAKHQRVLHAAEFDAVFAYRCAWRGQYCQVMVKPNSVGYARLGMVVAKRLLRRAVDRNQARRIIREVFRKQAASLPALDLVVRTHSLPEGSAWHGKDVLADLHNAIAQVTRKCQTRAVC